MLYVILCVILCVMLSVMLCEMLFVMSCDVVCPSLIGGEDVVIVDNNQIFYSIMENESLFHGTTRSGVE